MQNEQKKQELISALHLIYEEFETNPTTDLKANEVMLEIIAERIETITNQS